MKVVKGLSRSMRRSNSIRLLPIYLWVSGLLCLAHFVNGLSDIGRPYPGFYMHFRGEDEYYAYDSLTPLHWEGSSGRADTWFAIDSVVSPDGQRQKADRSLGGTFQRINDECIRDQRSPCFVNLELTNFAANWMQRFKLVPFTLSAYLDLHWFRLLLGAVLYLVGLTAYLGNSSTQPNRAFAWICSTTCIGVVNDPPALFWFELATPLSRFVNIMTGWGEAVGQWVFMPAAFWFTGFRNTWWTTHTRARSVLITLGLVTLVASLAIGFLKSGIYVLYAFDLLPDLARQLFRIERMVMGYAPIAYDPDLPAFGMRQMCMLGTALLILFNLIVGWTDHAQRINSIAAVLCLAAMGLARAEVILEQSILAPVLANPRVIDAFRLMAPLFVSYILLRQHSYNGRHGMFLILCSLALSGILASAVVEVTGVARMGGTAPVHPATATFLALFLVCLLFIWFQFKGGLWRVFGWETVQFGAVQAIAADLTEIQSEGEFPRMTLAALRRNLRCGSVVFFRFVEGRAHPVAAATDGPETVAASELRQFNVPDGHRILHGAVAIGGDSQPADQLERDITATVGNTGAIAAIQFEGRPLGILAIGVYREELFFHKRDIGIIQMIAQQIGLAWQSVRAAEERLNQARRIEQATAEAQDRERQRISWELHDTVQQNFQYFQNCLALAKRFVGRNSELAIKELKTLESAVEQQAITVQSIRNALMPIRLEHTFVGAVSELIDHVRAMSKSNIELHVSEAARIDELVQPAQRFALYRVIGQAVDNAVLHAKASRIVVDLALDHDPVRLVATVSDDGRGFDAEIRPRQALAAGHIGISTMRARIAALGGTLTIVTAPGEGTAVNITVGIVPTLFPFSSDNAKTRHQ